MVGFSDPGWLQGVFSTLVGMFDRVGLKTNVGDTVGMVFRPFQDAGTQAEAAYEQQITGVRYLYWEIQRVRVHCMECKEEMVLGLLAVHLQTQHGKSTDGRMHWVTRSPGRETCTYNMDLPTNGGPSNLPVKAFRGRAATWTAMRVHLLYPHVRDTVIILEEGNLPRPRCPRCNMMVPCQALNRQNLATA